MPHVIYVTNYSASHHIHTKQKISHFDVYFQISVWLGRRLGHRLGRRWRGSYFLLSCFFIGGASLWHFHCNNVI